MTISEDWSSWRVWRNPEKVAEILKECLYAEQDGSAIRYTHPSIRHADLLNLCGKYQDKDLDIVYQRESWWVIYDMKVVEKGIRTRQMAMDYFSRWVNAKEEQESKLPVVDWNNHEGVGQHWYTKHNGKAVEVWLNGHMNDWCCCYDCKNVSRYHTSREEAIEALDDHIRRLKK